MWAKYIYMYRYPYGTSQGVGAGVTGVDFFGRANTCTPTNNKKSQRERVDR